MDPTRHLAELVKTLNATVSRLAKDGQTLATAEREYKITLAKECMRLRTEGLPVTLIDKVAYGLECVAEARFRRDIAESVYKANLEAVNALKLQLRLIEAQIDREWKS